MICKPFILSIFSLLVVAFSVNAQLGPENLVVTEINTSSTTGTTLNLVEYQTSGNKINSTPAGNHNFYVGGAASSSGEGLLTLSTDRKLLTLYGYSKSSTSSSGPSNNPSTENPRALLIINQALEETVIPIADIHSGQAAKSAFATPVNHNSYGIYLAGSGTGVTTGLQYITYNTETKSFTSPISIARTNSRSVRVFNNQLYISSAFNTSRLLKVGNQIPSTPGQSSVNLPGNDIAALSIPNDFVMFGDNLLYITEEDAVSGGIKKFYYDGTEWKFLGLINSGIANDSGFRGLTGRLENGVVTLYGITSLNLNNSIVKITDNTSADNIADRCSENVSVKVLARATKTTGFRGIAFTPGTNITLPVSLTSFNANVINGKIKLNWRTSSEYNNSHFEVLHSVDGKDFKRVLTLPGHNNKPDSHDYSHTDENAANGTNYYILKQVDINGQSKTYGPISVNLAFKNNDFNIVERNGALEISFYTDIHLENGIVSIFNSNGQKIVSEKMNISKGDNRFIIPLSAPSGTYIVQMNTGKNSFAKKILKK